jgi:HEAT repeat protein
VPLLADFIRVPGAPAKVRLKAIETLGLIGHPAAIPALLELVRRKGRIFTTAEPTDLRVGAARALAAIGTPEAMDALRRLVDDEPRSGDKAALQLALETPRRAQGAP